jgi:hypothetical protein
MNLYLLFSERNLQILCFFENGIPDSVFRLGAVSCELGLGLYFILELVVGEIGWNQLRAQEDSGDNNENAKDEFD